MTLYSAFGVNGNGATGPTTSTTFAPGIIQGLSFTVTSAAQLDGFWYWRCDTAQSSSASFVLWQITGAGTGSTVAATTASLTGATAGAWNYIALSTPCTLTPNQEYMAVGGWSPNFADTHPYFGTGGTASAGITNGPLRVYSDSSGTGTHASNPQCAFTTGTSNPSSGIPATSNTDYNCWIDVQVETVSPLAGAPLPVPNPRVLTLLLEEAWTRADRQAQGVADLSVAFASTSGGIDTYNVTSPWNDNGTGSHPMRVLAPTVPNANYPHAFLIMLPVGQDQDTTNGDSIGTAQSITAHNTYNLTCVQPGYAGVGPEGPWYSDNPLDQTHQQEKFTLLVVNWVKKNLATTGAEKVYLIGFSRSGIGGQGLQFRHPYLFSATASWDAPFMMTDYDGTDPTAGFTVGGNPAGSYGTSVNFQTNYRLDTHLAVWQATGQYGVNRIWLGQGPSFPDTPVYDAALTAAGIPHTYNFSNTGESHAWHTDWVSAALATIIPSNWSQATTVLPQQIPRQFYIQVLETAAYRRNSGTTSAAVTQQGSASLSGLGSLTAGPVLAGSAALSGTGTLAAATTTGTTASLSGSGTLSAATTAGAVASLSGLGTLSAATTTGAAAALSGTGTLSALWTYGETAALSGSGTLSVSQNAGSANLTGTGTLTAAPQLQGAATLSGAGTLTAAWTLRQALTLSGTGTLTAAGAAIYAGSAPLSGTGTLTVAPSFQVARSTPGVTDPRDGTAAVTALATSSPGVT